jgi:enoyl-CoA hydratase
VNRAFISYSLNEGIAVVTIDRPPVNALNPELVHELTKTFQELSANDSIRSAILTGKGKAFVAGADVTRFPEMGRKQGVEFALAVTQMHRKIEEFDWPVIAAINGYALGGGCELAMACDIRIASGSAVFGQPEVCLGLIPGAGGTQRLPRLIPTGLAKMLLFAGDEIDAHKAKQIGLVDLVVDPGKELQESRNLARKITKNGPIALKFAKKSVNLGLQMSLGDALFMESMLFGELFETQDVSEGIRAFFEKRRPNFKGR